MNMWSDFKKLCEIFVKLLSYPPLALLHSPIGKGCQCYTHLKDTCNQERSVCSFESTRCKEDPQFSSMQQRPSYPKHLSITSSVESSVYGTSFLKPKMFQEGRFRYRLFYIIHLFSFSSTRCDSIVHARDGEEVNLEFPYPCNSTDATLQLGYRTPFYNSADPKSLILHPNQFNRISVKETFKNGICLLQLNISHVNRHDPGTYILLAQNNGYIERVGLRVEFLPGEAQCGQHEIPRSGHWVELSCTAPVGDIPGQILCYQDGTLMPWLSKPLKVGKSLEQTILVQQTNHFVFCCSSIIIKPKRICQCNDFVWDPVSNSESNLKDACPTASPARAIENVSSITSSNAMTSKTTKVYTLL